jgi:hypothetical protein
MQCRHRLEVRDRHFRTVYACELPEGHPPERGHRSQLLTSGLEVGIASELQDDPDAVAPAARTTTDVIVVWR